ncbi:Uma2 family endonuclease [Hanamia caeni]|jgi:Uma2 family endonuclease|uniref:Uma2 family endonuclease n=1 Tax=Hanamia caeni TaxID=2294116 RepID=A0A3M9N4R6_9BACT|nr:Uma2 family endonuclease [Hanamia caeni]RNI32726.1 Uma2 family endonuclease [Hanamia caeni]
MQSLELHKIYTPEEYFRIEEAGALRHEFINGNLIEMSGASRKHHKICKNLLRILESLLTEKGYEVFIENMKVKIEDENQYYYPDIFITKESETEENEYVQFQPELIAEVLSESTRAKDLVDKFIQYRKIKTLDYYLVVEPEKYLVLCNFKKDKEEWDMISYTEPEEIIALPKLNISISMKDIYKK